MSCVSPCQRAHVLTALLGRFAVTMAYESNNPHPLFDKGPARAHLLAIGDSNCFADSRLLTATIVATDQGPQQTRQINISTALPVEART